MSAKINSWRKINEMKGATGLRAKEKKSCWKNKATTKGGRCTEKSIREWVSKNIKIQEEMEVEVNGGRWVGAWKGGHNYAKHACKMVMVNDIASFLSSESSLNRGKGTDAGASTCNVVATVFSIFFSINRTWVRSLVWLFFAIHLYLWQWL